MVALVIGAGGIMYLVGLGMQIENNRGTDVIQVTDIVYVEDSARLFSGGNSVIKITSQEALVEILHASQMLEDRFYRDLGSQRFAEFEPVIVMDSADMMMADQDASFQSTSAPSSAVKAQVAQDYSTTNVQVKGVDEPDYLKTDGKYVYIVADNTLSIIDAYPAQDARLVLKTAIDVDSSYIEDMFLNGDRLVIFYNGESFEETIPEFGFAPQSTYVPATHALVVDIADRGNPTILKDYSIGGHFTDARMIGNHAYFVTNSHVDYQNPRLPTIHEGSRHVMTPDAFYFDNPERLSNFNTLTAIDVFGDDISSKSYLMGYSGTHYVSEDNFYLTYQQSNNLPELFEDAQEDGFYDVVVPLLPGSTLQEEIMAVRDDASLSPPERWAKISGMLQEFYDGIDKNNRRELFQNIERALIEHDLAVLEDGGSATQKVVIHKIAINGTDIEHTASGSVPGRLLNQFSMDEHGDRFRIATTTDRYTQHSGTLRENAVYILDEELSIVGGLDNIAPDESIFSARFIDDRLYLVTFQQIDPFFVIDLSEDTPKILGELKIPGFSNYLHPYDDEHVIGIGRDTKTNQWGGATTLGVKIALFNVADVSNPKVADEVVIGDRGTQSEALHNHKAFFLGRGAADGEGRILSVPITGNIKNLDGPAAQKKISGIQDNDEISWSGFYVFDLDPANGFDLKGTIKHWEGVRYSPGYLGLDYHARTFHIEDVLYTASERFLKMNSLDTLGGENSIMLKNTGGFIGFLDDRSRIVPEG